MIEARRRALAAGALALAASPALAISLGGIDVKSRPGEPLEARIPVSVVPGELLRGACVAPARGSPPGTMLELRRRSGGAQLIVRTRAPVEGASVAIVVAVGCPGAPAELHEFTAALAPAEAHPAPAPTAPRAIPPGTALPTVVTLAAAAGDSLAALARMIFPEASPARTAYLAALRDSNPALAAIADDEPLAPGTSIALPDLHAFAASRRAAAPKPPVLAARKPPAPPARPALPRSPAPASKAARAPQAAPAPAVARAPQPAPATAAPAASSAPDRAEAPAPPTAAPGFRLKLSGPTIDLAPTRALDARQRAELRERLRVLDADDRTAEMLAMRDTIRRLEARIADMELKLSRTPIAVPAPAASTPVPEPAPAATVPPPVAKPAPAATPSAPPAAHPPRTVPASAWYESPWVLPALLASLALLLAGWVAWRRARAEYAPEEAFEEAGEEAAPEEIAEPQAEPEAVAEEVPPEPEPAPEPQAPEPSHMDTLVIALPPVAPRVPVEDQEELRRRYMEERFPEIVNGALALEDADSVVNAARLLYEDGAVPRAIELLQFAIEQDAGRQAPWLALFEIFRRERLVGEFGRLARRFAEAHDTSPAWRKVLRIGRDMDPGDALYQGPDAASAYDPVQEDWLRSAAANGDAALAAELRERLMAEAAVRESDLRADPTPALRKSEDFTVA